MGRSRRVRGAASSYWDDDHNRVSMSSFKAEVFYSLVCSAEVGTTANEGLKFSEVSPKDWAVIQNSFGAYADMCFRKWSYPSEFI